MDWIIELITGNSVAHAIFIYSFVIAIVMALGKIKIFGISLGSIFVLFVGLAVGHFGAVIDPNILKFIQEFGLILFIFSIGLQVGPSFFSSFKEGGLLLNGLALAIIGLNIVVALAIYYCTGDVKPNEIVGILSGSVTNTPGLGAAQQSLIETLGGEAARPLNESMSMGYAAAYPLGVVGIILSMILVKVIFKVNVESDSKAVEEDREQSLLKPHVVTYEVTNRLIYDCTVERMHGIIDRNFVISRIKKHATGEVIVPKADTKIEDHDLLRIVISVQDEEVFDAVIGHKVEMDWKMEQTPVVSRRIVVTNNAYSGKKIGQLRLPKGYGLNATRVNRAGVELLASANLSLQVGDRITVVGQLDDINRLASNLGNSVKRLNQPNMFMMFIGIFVGILIGSIPIAIPGMTVPMKLGLAGGPLIAAICLGRWGYKIKIVTYTSSSANLMLRELGMCLFLASVGLAAGGKFGVTVFTATGARWVLYGFIITFIPLMIVASLARGKFKMNYGTLMGLISGSTTDPPALAYANKTFNNDAPAVAYSTVYPLTMFMRVITAQILILVLA